MSPLVSGGRTKSTFGTPSKLASKAGIPGAMGAAEADWLTAPALGVRPVGDVETAPGPPLAPPLEVGPNFPLPFAFGSLRSGVASWIFDFLSPLTLTPFSEASESCFSAARTVGSCRTGRSGCRAWTGTRVPARTRVIASVKARSQRRRDGTAVMADLPLADDDRWRTEALATSTAAGLRRRSIQALLPSGATDGPATVDPTRQDRPSSGRRSWAPAALVRRLDDAGHDSGREPYPRP